MGTGRDEAGPVGLRSPPQPERTTVHRQEDRVSPQRLCTDSAAGALAYVTIIPAIIFLVMAPYNQKPFIKFHAFQCIGLVVVWFCLGIIGIIPILGWLVFGLGSLALLVTWILCIVKASQGSAFKLPVIGNFAAQQSGYQI